jgi:hypothetical protein
MQMNRSQFHLFEEIEKITAISGRFQVRVDREGLPFLSLSFVLFEENETKTDVLEAGVFCFGADALHVLKQSFQAFLLM